MRTCGLVLMVMIGLLLIQHAQSQASQQESNATHVTNNVHYNCGETSKLLIALMRSVLSQCIKRGDLSRRCRKVPKNCAEVLKYGDIQSGVYSVDPDGKGAFKVYCDQKSTGGGWAVFQKRKDGFVGFYRGWNDYKNGFGNPKGEFWLGLDKINRLTHQARNRLRVELEDTKGKSAYAEYDYFAVSDEQSKYKLSLGKYSGTAGDALFYNRGMPFSTKDRDNDKSSGDCANKYKGAWWYNNCHYANLNGLYHLGKHSSFADGVNWYHWKGFNYSAKRTEMKIRPV